MKVLIDECLPRALKRLLTEHECRTVQEMGWAGKKNGLLSKSDLLVGLSFLMAADFYFYLLVQPF
jgi:riboflavin synthase